MTFFSCEDAAQQVLMSICPSPNNSIPGMHTDRISTRQYKTVQESTRQYITVQDSTKQYKTVQNSTRQYKKGNTI